MDKTKFYVRLTRPVFQVAVLEVEAGDHEEAVAIALNNAENIEDIDWIGEFDPESYTYDTQYVIETDEADEAFMFYELNDSQKYLLLSANTDSGEGETVYQPWMTTIGDLMTADMGGDWVEQLKELRDEGINEYYKHLEELQSQSVKKGPAKIIPFPTKD